MAFDYDVDAPLDDSYIADFTANERAARTAARDSVNFDHFAETSGHHRQVTLDDRAAGDPSTITTEGFIYAKITGDITELFYMDDQGKVIQLTDDGSASPDKMPLAGGEFSGDVTYTDADLLIEGTSLVKLLNAKYLQGRDQADAAWRDLIGVNASDEIEIGDASLGADGRIYVTDVDGLVVSYAAADKIVWNKGHFASAPLFTQVWVSSGDTIADGTSGSVAHGLGIRPTLWAAVLECTSTDNDYGVGDTIPVLAGIVESTPTNLCTWQSDTHFGWEISGQNLRIFEKGGDGGNDFLTFGKWDIIFSAWY
jgi:hypothetical protein